jgi:Flp pilus assembly pilin Flp
MRQAQTTLEYVYLVGIVAVALIVMLVYVSRGFQGNLRIQADQMGEQYSPKNMRTSITEVSQVKLDDTNNGTISTSNTSTTMTNRGQDKVVGSLKQESWN